MKTVTVRAERVAELMYELFKAKPWLNSAGVMTPQDAPAEAEAIAFLLTVDSAENWGNTTPAARRIVNSLLVDFIAKLLSPASSFSSACWRVPADAPNWQQALHVVAQEIRQTHPQLAARH